MTAVGHPDMGMQNPKYTTNTLRCQHEDEIYQVYSLRQADALALTITLADDFKYGFAFH